MMVAEIERDGDDHRKHFRVAQAGQAAMAPVAQSLYRVVNYH